MNKLTQILPALRLLLSPNDLVALTIEVEGTGESLPSAPQLLEQYVHELDQYRKHHGTLPRQVHLPGLARLTVQPSAGDPRWAYGRALNRVAIVTGGSQGFGAGIAACLLAQGAFVVVADLNPPSHLDPQRQLYVPTNVAKPQDLERLIDQTVQRFGGVDLFVSNAGILRAGGLDTLTPETFERVTQINYNAYFYCVQAVAPIMKLQTAYGPSHYFADIVQINSKSGLRGSKANFAYAGSKFGGVGLTQSFALELAPYRIKVNSICPGNYYEGPLWSDPENGLFVQYLKAGKVPGAQTIDDVRRYYMSQVPMGKGCNPVDVTRAVLYAMEQTCETGQAIPVTGGQVMLS